jgi:CDP-glucose 4,6-dehydratase
MNFNNTYLGKKVFVTGHTGFKGSWMVKWLSMLGANIKGYALAPENDYDLFHKINIESLCESVIADVRGAARLKKEIADFQPDFVFHLAAQPLVRLSFRQPLETFAINVMGTANLLEAVKKITKPCAVVVITTDKVYENKEWQYPYRETDRLGGYDPYSASKAAAEIVISSYRNSFFNLSEHSSHQKAIASARAGNVIGGGDWAKDRIIPDIVNALKNKRPIEVRNPAAVRPWEHVLEPLSGYLLLGEKLSHEPETFAQSWNFGPYPQDTFTVGELVETAIQVWGEGSYTVSKTNKCAS